MPTEPRPESTPHASDEHITEGAESDPPHRAEPRQALRSSHTLQGRTDASGTNGFPVQVICSNATFTAADRLGVSAIAMWRQEVAAMPRQT